MSFLLDTNVVSELRRGDAANPGVIKWFDDQSPRELFLSAITVGEIRQGIEQLRARDARQSMFLDRWLKGLVEFYEDRLLYVDGDVAEEWGRMRARRGAPVVDALIAATARVHDLTIVTRNMRDFRVLGVRVLNPWLVSASPAPRATTGRR
ncbi:MAG TPA: type II toxin-antitoxin system VapC family toxin [Vicinamibacterales bacterium]|nr:type II toxin-antitoxin system VapC family toxin [Vicinamibacterales bacterium]